MVGLPATKPTPPPALRWWGGWHVTLRDEKQTRKSVDELHLEPTAIVQISLADISGRKTKRNPE